MSVQEKIAIPEHPELMTEIAAAMAGKPKPKRPRALLIGGTLAVLSATSWFGWDYWTVGRFEVSTDDAYVQADSTTIAPKVSGYLDAVLVADNEPVKAGQV